MNPAVELRGVSVVFDNYFILDDLSVQVPAGEATFIVGKAGSGKSTLLKTAAGLIVPEKGQVLYRGADLARMSRTEELAFRRECAFAFQDGALWANQTIYNNLMLPLDVHFPNLPKAESDRRVVAAARRVGYNEGLGFRPVDLSTGEQKLISFARALILDPDLLFLDEPTASLDEDSVDRLCAILAELKAAGKTIVAVSHDPRLIAELADHLCVLALGKVAGFGPADEMAPLVGGELVKRIRAEREKNDKLDAADGRP
jgi:ABC-type transporter Mla maintaining outer membrane lipid asymmetry ATPase subunit MlaF